MAKGTFISKLSLWRDSSKGLKTRLSNKVNPPSLERDDIPDVVVNEKIRRGNRLQELRLKRYPTINVDHEKNFAGRIQGDISEARDKLTRIGFRNNPTAYVEVSKRNGPDDGSYSRLLVTETSGRVNLPRVRANPGFYRRVKDQVHVVMWEREDTVEFGAHREQHAWLQPARHVVVNDSNSRIGVRDFRDSWYDTFGEELGGKDDVVWETTH